MKNGLSASAKQDRNSLEQEQSVQSSLKRIKNKLLVMSGKGGVRKTSVAVNLAMALADKGHKVGLMDNEDFWRHRKYERLYLSPLREDHRVVRNELPTPVSGWNATGLGSYRCGRATLTAWVE